MKRDQSKFQKRATHLTRIATLIGFSLMVGLGVGCDDDSSPSINVDLAGTDEGGQVAGELGGAGVSAGDDVGGEMGGEMGGEITRCEPLPPVTIEGAYFIEKTMEWGLEGVQGTLLSVADLDGDGRADLVVRRGGVRADIIGGPEPTQHTWVMMNRTDAGQVLFEDQTAASGFLATRGEYPVEVGRPNWVVIFADIDNDGDVDAYSGIDMRSPPEITVGEETFSVDRESSEILLNDGSGHFTLTYAQDPLRRTGQGDVPSGAAFLDVNRDGWLDLWLSQGGLGAPLQDRLFVGRGQGEMIDRTEEFGLATQPWEQFSILNQGEGHSTAWSAAGCDLNGDGTPELLVGSYGRAPNHLWMAERDASGAVRYQNHSVASGFAFDNNQDWTGDQFALCYCQNNPSAEGCDEAGTPLIQCGQQNWDHTTGRQPYRLGGNTGAVVCEDLDGDGDLDLLTAEIRHWWAGSGSDWSEVLLNDGGDLPVFSRPGREMLGLSVDHEGVAWDEGHISATIFDFDNDGYQDILLGATDYPGNEALLFHNKTGINGTPSFSRLNPEEGIDHHRSHGVAIGDFDGDGDLDLILGHSRMRCGDDMITSCYPTMQIRAFENIAGQARNSVRLELHGGESEGGLVNADAIGARVEVKPLGVEDAHTRVRYVKAGYGHFGQQNEKAITVGLDRACEAEVTVTWPNSSLSMERFTVLSGQRYVVRPGDVQTID